MSDESWRKLNRIQSWSSLYRGPSIYDVHTEGGAGSGSDGRMWTGGGGVKNLIFVDVING